MKLDLNWPKDNRFGQGIKEQQRNYYILNKNKNVKVIHDVLVWAKWLETADRHIGFTKIGNKEVSTVFLGLDYNFSSVGKPVLFETMVFATKGHRSYDKYTNRYCTKAEALKGHKDICKLLTKK